MAATIEVAGIQAIIEDWKWKSDDRAFVLMLNAMLDPLGPSGADPAPDYHEAVRVAELLGGEVLEFDLPEYVEGRVY